MGINDLILEHIPNINQFKDIGSQSSQTKNSVKLDSGNNLLNPFFQDTNLSLHQYLII